MYNVQLQIHLRIQIKVRRVCKVSYAIDKRKNIYTYIHKYIYYIYNFYI